MRNRSWWWLVIVLVAVAWMAAHAQSFGVRWDGKELRVAAPEVHFLSGRVFERLRNGAAVALNIQMSISAGARVLRRSAQRFIVSYDLWEERFSVTRTSGERNATSHLTQSAAEEWCLDQTAVSTETIARDHPLTLRVEVRADDPRESDSPGGEPGLSLTALIEVFSRPSRRDEQSWTLQRGPFRLMEVRQNGKSSASK